MITVSKIKNPDPAELLHALLRRAFEPYRPVYTKEAFEATVVSPDILRARISSDYYTVYACYDDGHLGGTVCTKMKDSGELYFKSMAVSPHFSGKGLGKALLKAIEDEARSKNCTRILLVTYLPLESAIKLYENSGYRSTGNKNDYSGIEVFEMAKAIV